MTLFVVIPTADPAKIEEKLKEIFPEDSFRLPRGEWLVKYVGTSQELSNALDITEGTSGNAVIFAISSYYGRAPTNIWEWIKTRWN